MGPEAWFSVKLNTERYLKKPETFFFPERLSHFKVGRELFRFSFFSGVTRFLLCYDSSRAPYLCYI